MWWESLTLFQQVMFVVAVGTTGVLIVFLVLMIMGMDEGSTYDGMNSGDFDFDVDVFNDEPLSAFSGLRILTIRGILTFLSIGGWVAYLLSSILPPFFASVIGAIAGLIAAYLLALAFRASLKLESIGNVDYRNAIGKSAAVYIRIPKKNLGRGQVSMNVQGKLTEIDAVTEEEEDLIRNTEVVVVSLLDETTLVVKRKQSKGA
jgi:membrane protein implicated in regulation of membrane protease activity